MASLRKVKKGVAAAAAAAATAARLREIRTKVSSARRVRMLSANGVCSLSSSQSAVRKTSSPFSPPDALHKK